MTATKWMMATALALGATTAASADIGLSLGVAGRNGAFGFSYNQPYAGGYRGHYHQHYHQGHYGHHGYPHHGHYGSGWGVSVQAYQPAPRYYAPAYVYPQPRTVVVPPPVYVVPAYGY